MPIGFRTRQFAKLAGVTVRALHHYGRIGLLKPERTHGGYRLYREAGLARLERIIALKHIGVPLRKIKDLVTGDGGCLPAALRSQLTALEEKRRLLDRAIEAIRLD